MEKKIDAYENLEKIEKIGEGTYGKVYKVKDINTGQFFALKKLKLENEDEGISVSTLREISLLKALSNSNYIVRLLDVKHIKHRQDKLLLYLVFQYMDSDLKKYIAGYYQGQKKLPPQIIKSFLYQICKGVSYCHSRGVMHRDLKPSNLLVDQGRGLIKIADLGLGRTFTIPIKKYTHQIMTLWYRAPEVLLGDTLYSTAVDMWSVGCIFAEMSQMKPLFMGDSEISQLLSIFRSLGTPNESTWPGVSKLRDWHIYPQWKKSDLGILVPDLDQNGLDLLSKMLTYEPSKRISAKKAAEHPYFADLNKSQFDI